jgi:hypothetical protein
MGKPTDRQSKADLQTLALKMGQLEIQLNKMAVDKQELKDLLEEEIEG